MPASIRAWAIMYRNMGPAQLYAVKRSNISSLMYIVCPKASKTAVIVFLSPSSTFPLTAAAE